MYVGWGGGGGGGGEGGRGGGGRGGGEGGGGEGRGGGEGGRGGGGEGRGGGGWSVRILTPCVHISDDACIDCFLQPGYSVYEKAIYAAHSGNIWHVS